MADKRANQSSDMANSRPMENASGNVQVDVRSAPKISNQPPQPGMNSNKRGQQGNG